MAGVQLAYFVVHHGACPVHWTFERIRQVHLNKGWSDVGYQFGIERNGTTRYGREIWTRGAHCPPHNLRSWGVCVIGDNTTPDLDAEAQWRWNDHRWTREQWAALKTLAEAVLLIRPATQVVGHNEVGSTPTLCPGVEGATLRAKLGL